MIQLHVDILQNLQQAQFVLDIPSSAECSIKVDQIIIGNEEQNLKTIINFNGLIVDASKGTETVLPETNSTKEGQIQRTFKFPFLRLPIIVDNNKNYDLTNISCAECQSPVKIIGENQTFKIVQQQNANADDINEVIYCHRFCESHQHEHKHEPQQLHVPLDLHAELIVVENIECFIIAKEFSSLDLIHNDLVQCNNCSSHLGSFDPQNNLVSFNKSSLLPFSNDYLSTCFRHYEPGRYIVKVPKSNDSLFLVWILPNQLLSTDIFIDAPINSVQLDFSRMRKILFAHVTSSDEKMFTEWKRDFSVTTLLVNRFCLEHLSTAFQRAIRKFPNAFNSKETFQSVTISC
ncbi:unnamed protein product [Rotaria socialis]|uniref:HECT-type E3 ubiquitin transferase E3D n=3 Tax=Rotaria socialis TaxID=392032 RepID=A0A818PD36_9BILA|nr:unnamed protein product [Rotaria socialis]CAF3362647.1 unnamed protein product [Rotaria socialis]CAF3466260.1 unnamed protein product [Rotaria socialis]CAF3621437.1 unnamed protein product [Rotaria socialis]CAF3687593.1 unnamed protein product [Rotaria socialis]